MDKKDILGIIRITLIIMCIIAVVIGVYVFIWFAVFTVLAYFTNEEVATMGAWLVIVILICFCGGGSTKLRE